MQLEQVDERRCPAFLDIQTALTELGLTHTQAQPEETSTLQLFGGIRDLFHYCEISEEVVNEPFALELEAVGCSGQDEAYDTAAFADLMEVYVTFEVGGPGFVAFAACAVGSERSAAVVGNC